jgi:HAD superfamily hydrolase (TIGR01509 family)
MSCAPDQSNGAIVSDRKARYDLAVFDLDGTIIDSDASMAFAFEKAFRKIYPETRSVPLRELRLRQGMPFPEIALELGWSQDLSIAFKEESLGQIDKVHLFPHIDVVLDVIHSMNLRLSILTGKDRQRTLALLEHFSLSRFFTVIVCGDDPFPGKPCPDGLNHIIEAIGCRRERCIFFGDAPNDLAAARRAEVDFIGVRWAEQPAHLSGAEGISMLHTPWEIIRSLQGPTSCAISS